MSFQELIEKEREQRRTYILDSAQGLFFENGFNEVTMEQIARKVGLNKATLYLYFEDKDSLFFAIVLRMVKIVNERYGEIMDREISGREKCHLMGEAYFAFARQNPAYFRMLCSAGPTIFKNRDKVLARVVLEYLEKQARVMHQALSEGIADGSVRSDLDPLEMTVFLSVTTHSIVCLDPGWRTALEAGGIPYERFAGDYLRFMGTVLEPREPVKTKKSPESQARKSRT